MATVFAHRLFSASLTSLGCCQELLPHLRLRLARIGGLACLSALASASLAALPAATAAAKPAPSQPAAASATSPLGRLGPLPLDNGYPTPTTAQKLYDELDFQRATQAYLWALPAVGFKALYDAQAKTLGVRNGEVLLYRNLQDKAGMLTPNITTLYAFSFWDLEAQGPLVVEVPAGLTAGGVLDIWQQPITDMGQTGPDKGAGGKYLILPPGGPEVVAPGYRVVRATSNQVWFGTRGLAPDKVVAEATVRQHRLYGWNQRANPPATRFHEVSGRPWDSAQPADLSYWRLLSELYANEPVAPRDRMMFGMLAPLGLNPGQPFNPDARQVKILGEAAQLGDLMARTIAYEKRTPGATVYPGKHWEYAVLFDLDQESPDKRRVQLDERSSWFYEAIGMSVGMQGRVVGFGQVYLEASKDAKGHWLDGGRTYRLRVPASPPVKQFWSITLYNNLSRGPLDHAPGRRRSQLPQTRSDHQCRWLGGCVLWPGEAQGRQQLDPNPAGQGLVCLRPLLRPHRALLRQNLAAQ
ncbi:MAG: DUF1254 domain-containing protein [Cyanobacteriota bacterium]|nr:DUF1254 domain-containing protein [Cyanobacteriota bacterium]